MLGCGFGRNHQGGGQKGPTVSLLLVATGVMEIRESGAVWAEI